MKSKHSVSEVKLRTQLPSLSQKQLPSTKSLLNSPIIEKSKRNLLLLKRLKPIAREKSKSSSDGSSIMRRLESGQQNRLVP
jgi:hypothetical protein